ncbi:hypothetical protein DIS18_09750 [Algibacter marinivivus]|uniref:Putative auto-transporter adhesin head GIN domain-containing protein n=1 Tax=Algibacter marinivivus TaxID=2100723 RepID=A0A2U2X424_9FLAO|nr:DUF2807 domain-containing protein [Algibacter marinivivus]PWH82522.1 hypothetical protein DIS18_09750 [Algibacter marinivivus]
MKKITLLLILVTATGLAQIKGNENIETKKFNIENIRQVKINFYANITIDASLEESLTITTDSNLFDLIDKKVIDGILYLDQKEWISSSQKTIITIGAPNIYRVEQNTHDTTRIINIDNEEFRINAPNGNISIEGETDELRIGSERSNIDATKIIAKKAFINLWDRGKVKLNVTNFLWANVSNNGTLIYTKKPKKIDIKTNANGKVVALSNTEKLKNPDAKYINFNIKNNSFNRNHFFVIGPKPNGQKFSYGFPMMPQAKRQEYWTIGTKVYKVNKLGLRKLLITLKAEDENKTVKLF